MPECCKEESSPSGFLHLLMFTGTLLKRCGGLEASGTLAATDFPSYAACLCTPSGCPKHEREADAPPVYKEVMEMAWAENPDSRPTFQELQDKMKKICEGQ
ncbi:unnamed protein product [Dibothriocephalus latus]|uniref:Uncharacterized protein n=1 Tax=Dibothriocephalus latus TaxID=60516 RepID=A0A3P7NA99_DIBLA|nr:unnamed protein product [Dibothriocephalus latus]